MTTNSIGHCVQSNFGLVPPEGEGAQNCQPALNLNSSTKLQVCTAPRLTQNPCYAFVVLSLVSNSFRVLPSIFFHSVSPFAFRPITITAAVDGLLKM